MINHQLRIKNKTIVIAGASGGIGHEIFSRLSSSNKIIAIGRTTVKEADCNFFCDFKELDSLSDVALDIVKKFPKVDILIYAAGIGYYKKLEEISQQEVESTFAVNTLSAMYLTKALLPYLQEKVMYVGSGAGTMGMKGRSSYCASKFALRGFSLSMSEEYKGTDLQFSILTLGSTLTGFGPMALKEKEEMRKDGKAYFEPSFVADKLIEYLEVEEMEDEYILYPSEFGLGKWNKPA